MNSRRVARLLSRRNISAVVAQLQQQQPCRFQPPPSCIPALGVALPPNASFRSFSSVFLSPQRAGLAVQGRQGETGFAFMNGSAALSRDGSAFVRLSSNAVPSIEEASPTSEDKIKEGLNQGKLEVSDYWGIVPKGLRREDGSSWPWHCFRPTDTYAADVNIDIGKHYKADKWVDKLAYWTVKSLRVPVDLLFKNRHVSHALLLETVAAVPGMVGGMLLHFKSLRRFEHSGGWIKALLDEAENERMHLMTWVEVLKPNWFERALVLAVQGVFFNGYFLLYIITPRLSHRFVAYLEEEAVQSYTEFLEAIDKKEMPNGPAPLIAIDYWRLPKDATIRDVVTVVRADEAHHRDVNHFAADVYGENKELQQAPAPIDYH